jgi:hypothetical protein
VSVADAVTGPPSGPRLTPIRGFPRFTVPALDFRALLRHARPLPLLALLAGWWHDYDSAPEAARLEADPARAVVIALASQGLVAEPADVHFLPEEPRRFGQVTQRERAVVRANRQGEPADIFLVQTRHSPDGEMLELTGVYNLSETSAADERSLAVSGSRAAWAIGQEGTVHSVHYVDFTGEPRPEGPGWTPLARLQNAITNLQQTGQFSGIRRRSFKLEPAAYKVVLGFSPGALVVDADSHRVRIPTDTNDRLEGERYVREMTPQKARPGNLVTWAVDRVRAVPWFGDEKLQLLKAVAFESVDQIDQLVGNVTGNDGAEQVAEELGNLYAAPVAGAPDPVTGWPPEPMEPMLNPPLRGEGKWTSLENDPFVQKNPGAPSPFVSSFIRTDRKRIWSQVFVTLWDPRQIELHAVSGTDEPKSATGETGTGEVPRDPKVMTRYVAAFNGGFQTIHGAFGMMAERTLYLPPKPYAATIAKLEDGSTGFGTWPESPELPKNIVSFRQNMTALIVDEEINPYKRHWWGGVPPGWTEEARTVRSALCMTKEGFVGYFYGSSVDPDVLALAMKRARCTYGVHLDMNPGHNGLEFYRVAEAGKLPKIERKLEPIWEQRGDVPGMPGYQFLARRMIKYMALMNFPRYINTESRDFFYLTLRHILPGDPITPVITPAEPGEGSWRVHDLPQHGWPYALATTNLRPDPTRPTARVGLIKVDPKMIRAARPDDPSAAPVVEFRAPKLEGAPALSLWHSETKGFVIASLAPEPRATRITPVVLPDDAHASPISAAVGVDAGGMLVYARVTEGLDAARDPALLEGVLKRLGCEPVALLPKPLGVVMGESGSDSSAGEGVRFVRAEGPQARRIFPDTPIVSPKVWAPLQQRKQRPD